MFIHNFRAKSLLCTTILRFLLFSQWSRVLGVHGLGINNSEPRKWWQEPFGMFQTNLREIDADMDVDQVASYIEQFGATAWLIGVGGIQAQYPTDLPFQERNPYLSKRESGDLVGDALEAARKRGLRLLARMDFSKVPAHIANEHPDWLYRSPTGETQNHTAGLVSVCPSGPYYQERMFDILGEMTSRYQVDGMFSNWASFNEEDYYKVYHGVCHCENCKPRWAEYAPDLELPNGPEDQTYPQWLNFSKKILENWRTRVIDFFAERLPDAGLMLGDSADIMWHEANNAIGRELWPHQTSETVSTYKSYRVAPVIVNSVAFVDMPYRMGSEEPANFAQYLLQTISRGGNPSTYIMGTPGKIPYLCLGVASEITSFHKKWKDVYDGLRPVAKTGLVLPNGDTMSGARYEESLSEFRGLYKAMQELHIPFDVLALEYITEISENGGLERYQTIILPDLGELASGEANALDEWVAAGGSLVATGSSGVGNDTVSLKSLPYERRRDVITENKLIWSTYFAPSQNDTELNIYSGPIVPVYGSYHVFDWKEGTSGIYKLLANAPFSPPEYAYGNVQVNERGAGIGAFKDGKGIVIPFTVGRGYYELGLKVFRDFYEMVLRQEGEARENVMFNISEQVEVTLNSREPGTIVVHLINMSGLRHQNFGTHLPVPAGTIRVSGVNVTAHALVADAMLVVRDGEITLPALGQFEVVVIKGLA
ncbi:glycosyl hydrolase 6-domain-containing protein [Camillea tinctor]|nr:glycosyl hydrolase 6-domain-containing protein [Camillea tinctor]